MSVPLSAFRASSVPPPVLTSITLLRSIAMPCGGVLWVPAGTRPAVAWRPVAIPRLSTFRRFVSQLEAATRAARVSS